MWKTVVRTLYLIKSELGRECNTTHTHLKMARKKRKIQLERELEILAKYNRQYGALIELRAIHRIAERKAKTPMERTDCRYERKYFIEEALAVRNLLRCQKSYIINHLQEFAK